MTTTTTSSLNLKIGKYFDKYIGVTIFDKKSTNNDCQFILTNLQRKLEGWQTNFLNMVG